MDSLPFLKQQLLPCFPLYPGQQPVKVCKNGNLYTMNGVQFFQRNNGLRRRQHILLFLVQDPHTVCLVFDIFGAYLEVEAVVPLVAAFPPDYLSWESH